MAAGLAQQVHRLLDRHGATEDAEMPRLGARETEGEMDTLSSEFAGHRISHHRIYAERLCSFIDAFHQRISPAL